LPHPPTICATHWDDPAISEFEVPLPWIVKPVDNSGSRGVVRVAVREDLPAAISYALTYSGSGSVCIQKELNGTEFGAQAVVHDGNLQSLFLHNDLLEYFVPVGHSVPWKASVDSSKIRSLVERCIEACNMRSGVMNFDFILQGDSIWIIEFSARAGGGSIPELILCSTGVELYDAVLSLAFGQRPELRQTHACPAASRAILSEISGRIIRIEVPRSVSDNPNLLSATIESRPGDFANSRSGTSGRLGYILAKGGSVVEAEHNAAVFCKSIIVEIA